MEKQIQMQQFPANIKCLGKNGSYMLFGPDGNMTANKNYHLAKGTVVYRHCAIGCGMDCNYVIIDDNMTGVIVAPENYKGPEEITEFEITGLYNPIRKIPADIRPISQKFGAGLYFDDSGILLSDEVIEASIKYANDLSKAQEIHKKKKAEEKAALIERLKVEYSYLERVSGYDSKATKANMLTELKKKYPGQKFTGRIDRNTVVISWTDGPTEAEVKGVISKYKTSYFNGMTDSTEDISTPFNTLYGGVDYVNTARKLSDKVLESVKQEYADLSSDNKAHYPYKEGDMSLYNLSSVCINDIINHIAHNRSYYVAPPKETPTTAVNGEEVSGGAIKIVDYSEKSVAVIGDTKPIKNILKALKGRFNPALSCGPGWIFSVKNKAEIVKKLKKYMVYEK